MALSTMASASTGVMNSLLGKLATLMGDEYRKLKGVRNKVASLQDEFSSMNALLVKLAGMDELDAQAKVWRDQVREMSYDVEDCIDDFMHDLKKKGAGTGFLKKAGERLKKLMVRYQIANKIQVIETRVSEVHERRMRYKIDEYTVSPGIVTVDPRALAIYAEASGLVGIDGPRDELVKLLVGEEEELKVASIVGFGGLGKTTLANEVYSKLQGQFDCHAFVSVSQKPDIPRLLSKVLSQFTGQNSADAGDLDDILKNIRKYLQNKRYFIIIDDLWDSTAWNIIRCAFPENSRACRVLTTTRIYPVGVACCSNSKEYVYMMKSLNDQDSRRLFCGRIFGSGVPCPAIYEEDSTHILKKCGGLPLAIISISSLLAGQSKPTWEYVRKSLGSMFEGNHTLEEMKQILDLSYRYLPQRLKTCLLYVGMYPEDHVIPKIDLLRQWIAEGFVSVTHGLNAEDVAESYFNELINMSMIQPVRTSYNDEVLWCRVHDIMLDLIKFKAAEENFIAVMDDPQVLTGGQRNIRRVSLQYGSEEHGTIPAIINESLSQVRSIAVFRSVLKPFFLELKYVRVLHLQFSKHEMVDLSGIHGLFLLRYLNIVGNSVRLELPTQIGDLQQLETIDVESVKVNIPSDIVTLCRLTNLILPICTMLPDGIDSLKSLRSLRWFDLGRNSVNNIECLGRLTNLRVLHLYWIHSAMKEAKRRVDALHSSLERLFESGSLTSLVFENWMEGVSFDGLSTLSASPRHLRELHLYRCWFSRIPVWIGQLHDLSSLELSVQEVVSKDGDVAILAGLSSLVHLSLNIHKCTEGRVVISGSNVALPALKHLEFNCPKPFLAFEAGAVPRLQTLQLCFDVKGWEQGGEACLPVGVKHLPASLRRISLLRMYSDTKPDAREMVAAKSVLRNMFDAAHPSADLIFAGWGWDVYHS